MKIFFKRFVLFFLFSCFFIVPRGKVLASEGEQRNVSFGVGVPVSVPVDELLFKWWVTDNITIEPSFGFNMISVNDNRANEWKFGLGVAPHWGDEKLVKSIGVGFSLDLLKSGSETFTDRLLSLEFGLEYFVKEKLSLTGVIGGAFVFADDDYSTSGFPAGSTTFTTVSALVMGLYF